MKSIAKKWKANRAAQFDFESMERRELMTADVLSAFEPTAGSAPTGYVASPVAGASQARLLAAGSADGNDTMAGATNFGTASSVTTKTGSVGGSDPVDFWKFRVANSGSTTVRLEGLSRDVDVQVLDSTGRVMATGARGGTSSESVTVTLQSDRDYFLKVYPYGSGGSSSYRLTVAPPAAAGNDTIATATSIGVVQSSAVRTGSVGGSDRVDYYSFRTPDAPPGFYLTTPTRTVEVRLDQLRADIDVQLVDAQGRVLASSSRGGTSSESLRYNVVSGQTVYVRVVPYGSAVSDYRLTVSLV